MKLALRKVSDMSYIYRNHDVGRLESPKCCETYYYVKLHIFCFLRKAKEFFFL